MRGDPLFGWVPAADGCAVGPSQLAWVRGVYASSLRSSDHVGWGAGQPASCPGRRSGAHSTPLGTCLSAASSSPGVQCVRVSGRRRLRPTERLCGHARSCCIVHNRLLRSACAPTEADVLDRCRARGCQGRLQHRPSWGTCGACQSLCWASPWGRAWCCCQWTPWVTGRTQACRQAPASLPVSLAPDALGVRQQPQVARATAAGRRRAHLAVGQPGVRPHRCSHPGEPLVE
jgi:hypothetical protein